MSLQPKSRRRALFSRRLAESAIGLSLATTLALSACTDAATDGSNTGGVGGGSIGGQAAAGGQTTGGQPTSGGETGQTGGVSSGGTPGIGGTGGGTSSGGSGGAPGGGGAGGSTGATAGSGGGDSGLVEPIERGGKYVLEFGTTFFEVDPQVGGRVTQYSLDGANILAGESITQNATNWGSTFWPAPQREWDPTTGGDQDDWPPIDWIDSGAYTGALEGETIVLTSAAPPSSTSLAKLSLVKRYSADVTAGAIDIEFILTNEAAVAASWAPWQVSRVAPDGLSFFPTGTSVVDDTLATMDIDGITWFQHDSNETYQPAPGHSHVADVGDPWVAHTDGNLVFVKTFPSITPAQFAPGIGEVKLYAAATSSGEDGYEEVEILGPYTPLDPGASLTWSVRWYLRPLPDGASATAGNVELSSFVQDLVQ